jgi:hypothetical protein
VGLGEAVQIEIHQREAHHVGRDVVALEVGGEAGLVVGSEGDVALLVGVGAEDVLEGGDEESDGAAGGIEHGLGFLGVDDGDHEVDDMARGAELTGIALGAEHGEQILEGIAEFLRVIVAELVDDLEESAERLGIAIRQVGIFKNVPEECGDAGVFWHPGDGLGIEGERFMTTQPGAHELGPAVTGIIPGEKRTRTAELLRLRVHVVHELIDHGDGDLLDLGLGIGDLADEDVAGGVDAAFGVGV